MASNKVTLAPGTGAQFGLNAGGVQGRAQGNPIPYMMPWAAAFCLLAVAMGIRFVVAHDDFAWYWSAFTFAGYAALTFITWRASRPRGVLTCRLATVGVAAAGAWSWYVAGVHDLTWRPFAVYAGMAFVVCGGAMAFSAFRHGPGDGQSMHDQIGGAIAKLREISRVRIKDGQVIAQFGMEPGTPAASLQQAGPALASLHGVPTDGVRVLPSRHDARVGELRISPTNPLDASPPWLGPSIQEGGSIMDPIVAGVRRGGQPLQLWLPGDADQGRNASLVQVTGMSGAGKTEFIRLVLVELLSRGGPDEVEYWYGNSRKADQEPRWVEDGSARFERDRKGVAKMLHDLRAEAPERARILGEQGLDQWQPGCGLAFRLVVGDEFADVAPDVERLLTDLAETMRSLGVILLLGFQRATGSRFPTDARSNFGTHACFGVKDDIDASMALPEEVIDAGAAPWRWGNKVPGMCYLTAPGVAEDLWTDDARTFKPNRDLMGKWAQFYIAARHGGATGGMAPSSVPVPAGPAGPADDPGGVADLDEHDDLDGDDDLNDDVIDLDDAGERDDADEAEALLRDVNDELGEDLDDVDEDMPRRAVVPLDCREAVDVDHREPIDVVGGGMRLALSPQMPPQAARAHVRSFLAAMHGRGIGRFKKEDVGGDLLAEVGYRASWLDKVLKEFCGEQPPWLVRVDQRGWYDIVAAPIRAIEGDAR